MMINGYQRKKRELDTSISMKQNLSKKPSHFIESNTETYELNFDFDINLNVVHCLEHWPNNLRIIYSYFSGLIQYILPFIIVGMSYGCIWWKLKIHRTKLKKHSEIKISNRNFNSISKSNTALKI